ncbi:MAG: DMT family transporter [Heliomarina sp.]|uniref:DMT family transporter n=1 Tax=Heliomarina sp. TaxID=2917556 RepID=UPI00405845C8
MTSQTRGILLALMAFAVYAFHDTIIKFLGGGYSPFQVVFFTMLYSFPLGTVMMMSDRTPGTLRPVHPWWTNIRAISMVIASGACFYAFSVLPLADTYAILFATPILITLLAIPILGEQVRLRRGLAIFVGLVGVVIVLQPGQSPLTLGHGAALLASVCAALVATIVRKIGREERSVVMLIYPWIATLVVMGAAMPFVYNPMEGIDMGMNAGIAVLAFIALLLIIEAYKRAEAALIAPMQYSQMLWAIFYGWLFFDEWPGQTTFIGVALIIASGLYIVFREASSDASENTPVLRSRSRPGVSGSPGVGTALRSLRLIR